MSSDIEMAAHNAPKPMNSKTTRPKRADSDYSLPPSFTALLVRPITEVIEQLIPLRPGHVAPGPAKANATDAPVVGGSGSIRYPTDSSGSHQTTGSGLVNLFFDMTPPLNVPNFKVALSLSYKEDPLATVKLIFQTRSIHEGKGSKEGFWVAAGWLWTEHPRTFLANLHLLVDPTCKGKRSRQQGLLGVETLDEAGEIERNLGSLPINPIRPHGTFDDLIDLLVLHVSGQLNGYIKEIPDAVDQGIAPSHVGGYFKDDRISRKAAPGSKRDRSGFKLMAIDAKKKSPSSFRHKLAQCQNKDAKFRLFTSRLETLLTGDPRFQALFCTAVDIFVRQLRIDLSILDKHIDFLKLSLDARKPFLGTSSPHLFSMSLAAKWVPSLGKSADRQLHFASAIAMILFPGEGVNRSRERLQWEVLAPLRKALKIPEINMGSGAWKIDYTTVPSRAMAKHAVSFLQHDPVGFGEYISKVAAGKMSISGVSLFPHEILMTATSAKDKLLATMADLQWRSLVDSFRSKSSSPIQNCLAIADVSSSMGSFLVGTPKNPQPITICIALTLLLGEPSSAPWNGMCFTFSSTPTAQYINPSLSLAERAKALSLTSSDKCANLYKVFDLILKHAVTEKLDPAKMVKKLFVFSDMHFDRCTDFRTGGSEYAMIRRKFAVAGYTLPELIFWNLAGSTDIIGAPKPVRANQEGVSLLSGYSGNMMKYFLGDTREEDESLIKAMGSGWEKVGEEEDSDEDMYEDAVENVKYNKEGLTGAARRLAEKRRSKEGAKRDSPLSMVRKILAADSFKGVVVVD